MCGGTAVNKEDLKSDQTRRSWEKDLNAYKPAIPKDCDQEQIVVQVLLAYNKLAQSINCPATLAWKRLVINSANWTDSKLAKLSQAIASAESQWSNTPMDSVPWTEVLARVASIALPTNQYDAILTELTNIQYTNISQFDIKVKKLQALLEILGIPIFDDKRLNTQLENAIAKSEREGNTPEGTLSDFLTSDSDKRTWQESITLLTQIEGQKQKEVRLLKKHPAPNVAAKGQLPQQRGIRPPAQQQNAQTQKPNTSKGTIAPPRKQTQDGTATNCTFCNRGNHAVADCKDKLYGPYCIKCSRRHTTTTCPAIAKTYNAQAEVIEIITYNADVIRKNNKDYVSTLTKLCVLSPNGGKIPIVSFLDTGARKSLVSEDYFNNKLKPHGFNAVDGDTYLVKGVDSTGEGIKTSRSVKLTWEFPKSTNETMSLIIVPHLPEPILLGRDWQQTVGVTINNYPTPETCNTSLGLKNHQEPLLEEDEYRKLINPNGNKIAAKLLKEKRIEQSKNKRLNQVF